MLQSLNAKSHSLPRLDGYYYPPEMGLENGRVKVATYVSTRLKYLPQESPARANDCRLLSCSVRVQGRGTGQRKVTLVNVYYPDRLKSEASATWLSRLDSAQSKWVIGGDFNASHELWDTVTTPSGNHLEKAVDDSDLILLNDGSFTHIGYIDQRNSAVNISLASPELGLEATWETGSDPLQSDHLPIHLELGNVDPDPEAVDTSPAYQYNRADWELFQNCSMPIAERKTHLVRTQTNIWRTLGT